MRTLIRNTRKERELGKPPKNLRALFQVLREIMDYTPMKLPTPFVADNALTLMRIDVWFNKQAFIIFIHHQKGRLKKFSNGFIGLKTE